MNLQEFVLQLAGNALLRPEKYLCSGHNGPYHDPETPVRNFGHWLITFARCYEWTGERRFGDKVSELAEYLCSEEARPYGFSFYHRSKPDKDRCNGLIGQAWTFEALAEASAILKNDSFGKLAEEVFFQHPFDYRLGLWKCLEIDGKVVDFDATFNHQLWFAACSSLVQGQRRQQVMGRVSRFLDLLKSNMTLIDGGCVYHPIERLFESHLEKKESAGRRGKRGLIQWLGAVVREKWDEKGAHREKAKEDMRARLVAKSIGYHAFNLYALALLKPSLPTHPFWKSGMLIDAAAFMLGKKYVEGLKGNPFGYPYNPPGFEVPYALSLFGKMPRDELIERCSWWVRQQLKRCYNEEAQLMDGQTEDPMTHTARIYELTRLEESLLGQIEVL
jgi:hypothetical protein